MAVNPLTQEEAISSLIFVLFFIWSIKDTLPWQ